MTIVSTGSMVGSVTELRLPGSMFGFVESVTGLDEGSMSGTVLNDAKISFDGETTDIVKNPSLVPVASFNTLGATFYGFRVILDSVDVTSSVIGEISVLRDLDRLTIAEVAFQGKQFSFIVTENTWTQTRIDIHFSQGVAGKQSEILYFSGYVDRGTYQGDLIYSVTAVDLGSPSSQNKVCLELSPDTGLTRDEIVKDIVGTAGFVGSDLPGMRLYDKPYSFTSEVWSQLVEFVDPEGLHLRVNTNGIVEAYEIKLRETPDHIWDVAELLERPVIVPPDRVESVWIFRGDTTVEVTETEGVTIEFRSTPIFGIDNVQSTHVHNSSDGSIVERNFELGAPHSSFTLLQLIRIIESEIHRVGNRIVKKIERQSGLFNPASARYRTVSGETGPGPQGSVYVQCYVLDGEFVVWPAKKFVKTLERIDIPIYDEELNDVGSVIESNEWFRKRRGFRNPCGSPPCSGIAGVLVGGDNMSYAPHPSAFQIEGYGLKSRFDVERVYDVETGAQADEIQRTFGWYSVQTEVANNYQLFDGTAQEDLTATFQLIELTTSPKIVDFSGRLVGEVRVENEYFVRESDIGANDWGPFNAEGAREVFRTVSIESDSYDAISNSVFTKTTYTGTGLRRTDTFPGRPPLPRYLSSAYTRYGSEPSEVIIDDPLVESWFGKRARVVQIQHALDIEELGRMLIRARSRQLSFQVRVVRLQTLGRIGDNVLVIDGNQGLFHVGIIISIRDVRTENRSVSEYHIEIPLIETGLAL